MNKKLMHRSTACIWVPGLYGASGATGSFFIMQKIDRSTMTAADYGKDEL